VAEVVFFGESFTIAERIGLMPLMRFAKVAQSGVDSNELAGLAAMYDLLEQCIAEQDWQRFQDTADSNRADGDELMAVVSEVMEKLTERPTKRPSDSSAGPQPTAPSSTAASSSPVIDRLEGRPDLQLIVKQAEQARAAG
jgi:hypothetical protein